MTEVQQETHKAVTPRPNQYGTILVSVLDCMIHLYFLHLADTFIQRDLQGFMVSWIHGRRANCYNMELTIKYLMK